MNPPRRLWCVATFATAILASTAVPATTLTLGLDIEFSGGFDPEGGAPWATAVFDDAADTVGANGVRLTMSTANLTDQEFISGWYFNFDDALEVTLLSFTLIEPPDVPDPPGSVPNSINTAANTHMADGDGKFDIFFDFPPPPGNFPAKFTTGEVVVYDIEYTSAIDVTSFDFTSDTGGGQGSFLSAAHVQGIGPSNGDSGWIGAEIPEPGTIPLLGAGLIALAAKAHRQQQRASSRP